MIFPGKFGMRTPGRVTGRVMGQWEVAKKWRGASVFYPTCCITGAASTQVNVLKRQVVVMHAKYHASPAPIPKFKIETHSKTVTISSC